MYYILPPLFFLAYLEILGRYIVFKLSIKKIEFSFIIGFISLLSFSFVVGIFPAFFELSFDYLLYCHLIFVLLSVILIIKDFKKIDFGFNVFKWLILIVVVIFIFYNSINMSLGDTNGFDSQFYLNMIVDNIKIDKLYSLHPYFGTTSNFIQHQYKLQAIYHLFSVFSYISKVVFDSFNYTAFFLPLVVFFSQIIFHTLFVGICLEILRSLKIKNILLISLFLMTMVLFYQFKYYNLQYGYIGNSYRFMLFGLLFLNTVNLFNSKDNKNMILIALTILSLNATSSSNSFIIPIFLYSLFYIMIDEENNTFRFLSILITPSFLNLGMIVFSKQHHITVAILSIIFGILLYIFNDKLVVLFRKLNLKVYLTFLIVCAVIFINFKNTGKLFDLSLYHNNIAGRYDMNYNYFLFTDKASLAYNLFIYISGIIFLFKNRQDKLRKFILFIIVVFFNPFMVYLFERYNPVWARSFELLINPFTLLLLMEFKNIKMRNVIYIFLILVFFKYSVFKIKPIYYHESFKPSKKFNWIFKYDQDYVDIFYEIDYMIKNDNIKKPKIITDNGLIRSVFHHSMTLYGRENLFNEVEKDYELYKIFYPSIYYGDVDAPKNPDNENLCRYLKDSDYHFIIQDKSILYRNLKTTYWYELYYKIEECGYYPSLDTDKYRLYKLYE